MHCSTAHLGLEHLDHPVSETVDEHYVCVHPLREGENEALDTLFLDFAGKVAEQEGP